LSPQLEITKLRKNQAYDEDKEPHVEICSLLLEQFLTEVDSKDSRLNYEQFAFHG
jgi:hypothetical protein